MIWSLLRVLRIMFWKGFGDFVFEEEDFFVLMKDLLVIVGR